MEKLFLGVDTSNYTTSLALCAGGRVIKNVRRLLPVSDGACGLRQSDAVFLHTKALPELAETLFSAPEYRPENLVGIGVSIAPRDALGSYMPCFLAGLSFAAGIAGSHGLPLYRFSHQAGHVMAGIMSSGCPSVFAGEFLSFHVSGGTTEALFVKPRGASFSFEVVGGTSDASAGQIIDRAGVRLALAFPCGKALDALSLKSTKALPVCVSMKDGYFSLSGLQNRFERYMEKGETPADGAAFLFESIGCALERATVALRERYGKTLPVLYAGGVMCNSRIRSRLSRLTEAYFASPELSSDNACGTALLCERAACSEHGKENAC